MAIRARAACTGALLALVSTCAAQGTCRDQNTWPFAAESVWNTPIGGAAVYAPAGLFVDNNTLPHDFFSDDDYFITTSSSDPVVPWYNQGWWGNPGGAAHCNVTGGLAPTPSLHFPANVTVTAFGNNNAAAILQPDNRTLVLTQPLYVCSPGAPVLSLYDSHHGTTDIRGNGTWGGHGGSSLSAIGGTIRLGELLPGAPPISHPLKLELFAHQYYWQGNATVPCYTWPALNCDGYATNCQGSGAYGCYNGSNPAVRPGALLAAPPAVSAALAPTLATQPARMMLAALTDYGGYLVDDTFYQRVSICTEHGVEDEFAAAWGFPFHALPGTAFYSDLLAVMRALAVVVSNGPGSPGGGGAPRQPPPPPFCD